jgi:hypothetical protein
MGRQFRNYIMNVVMTLEEWYDRKIADANVMIISYEGRYGNNSKWNYWCGVRQGFIEAKEILTKVVV